MLKYRLGLDMGATSIGWAVYDIEKKELIKTGVRIFDDGREDKTKASLCVKRRSARGLRRLQKRKHIQKEYLLQTLIKYGLMPTEESERQALKVLNPYELRAKALDEKLSLFELGRVFFNLVQRKGFLSNRKDNKEEGGKLKAGFDNLQLAMQEKNVRTYGEFLYKNQQEEPSKPIRLKNTFDATGKFLGGLFPFREVYKKEFQQIFDKQKTYYPEILTEECRQSIENILFFQRPLKEQEEGFCLFEEGEKRIPKAHPLFQEFRIWQHVINLKFVSESDSEYTGLSKSDCQKLAYILQHASEYIKTKQALINYTDIKKLLGLDKKGYFNYETSTRAEGDSQKGILVDKTQYAIDKSVSFKSVWDALSDEAKGDVINVIMRPEDYIKFPKTRLSIEESDKLIIDYLCARFGMSNEAASELLYQINLEDGFGSLSEKAIRNILPFIKSGMLYSDACESAGYHHSVKQYAHCDKLPYYGEILYQSCLGQKPNPKTLEERYGKINNATVHVALNQVRYLVNELIDLYGKPSDIAIEYARDLGASKAERLKLSAKRDANEAENERIRKELNTKLYENNWTHRDIEKYKIWKNMGIPRGENPLKVRECPFSGKKINVSDLLNGQLFQIEHLIPFSKSLDDSINNKVIASVEANRYKANRTPYEAFHESQDGYIWADIQRRAKKLSYEQQWRFSKDAMKKFEEQEGPIARSLNDTRYMTRILQNYLLPIVHENGTQAVQAVAGQLTAMVRDAWGLNQYKNKEDEEQYRAFHNHHAVDAIVAATIERGQINAVARQLKTVHKTVTQLFADEFYKFKDPSVSKEDKKDLKRRIRDMVKERKLGIVKQYIPMPENLSVPAILKQVDAISISHKPKLKDVKQKDSTIGQLHEDTAYGLQCFCDETSLLGKFKVKGSVKTQEITEYIPMFRNKADKAAYYEAYKNWFVIEGKSKIMDAKTKEEKQIKQNVALAEAQAVQALRQAAEKAFKWFIGGNNFCVEIYEVNPQNKIQGVATRNAGNWENEIISNYNASVRSANGEHTAYWRYKYPNAKRVMRLKRNDMVMGVFTREQVADPKFIMGIKDYAQAKLDANPALTEVEILFRVKKMKSIGSVYLTPHDIAKEDGDAKSWCASTSSLQKYKARKVTVTPTGRILNAK